MEFQVDILLRGAERATTEVIDLVAGDASGWTDRDVEAVLKEMLRALDRVRNPSGHTRDVFLRGISWIVEPFETGGVVIALEIPTGAAIAGPFRIGQAELEAMITRILTTGSAGAQQVH